MVQGVRVHNGKSSMETMARMTDISWEFVACTTSTKKRANLKRFKLLILKSALSDIFLVARPHLLNLLKGITN